MILSQSHPTFRLTPLQKVSGPGLLKHSILAGGLQTPDLMRHMSGLWMKPKSFELGATQLIVFDEATDVDGV